MSENPTCPWDGGELLVQRVLRDGCLPDDPEAYAYYYACRTCAATGPWSKSESGMLAMVERLAAARQPAPEPRDPGTFPEGAPGPWEADESGRLIADANDELVALLSVAYGDERARRIADFIIARVNATQKETP